MSGSGVSGASSREVSGEKRGNDSSFLFCTAQEEKSWGRTMFLAGKKKVLRFLMSKCFSKIPVSP